MKTASISTNRTWSKTYADIGLSFWGWDSFITTLRGHYEADDELPALVLDSSIPRVSLEHCFVNLALIEQVAQEKQERALLCGNEGADAALECGELYNALLEMGSSRDIGKLFYKAILDNRAIPAGWLCITGRAGTGKTTLLQYIAYRWGLRESLWNNRFDFVLRAKLNLVGQEGFWDGLSGSTGEDYLAWLIFKTLGCSKGLSLKNIRSCLSSRANQVLILLDGFDEIQTRYGEGRDVRITALVDAAMQFPNGILTTRPNAVPASLVPKFEQCFENLGLTQDNVRHYVTHYFNTLSKPHLGDSLLSELSSNLEMMSLAQIPVNIAALCLTWEQKTSSATEDAFTMTMLYQRVVIWLARRYDMNFRLTPSERAQGINPATMPTLQILERCKEELQTLAKLAYDGFINNEIQTLSHALLIKHFPESTKLHRITAEFGLLRKESLSKTNDTYAKHYFIHLTYQEYFTALYMAQQLARPVSTNREEEITRRKNIQEVVRFMVNNKNESRCTIIWVFLAGFVSTVEYAQGADYFWDAFIDLDAQIDTKHILIGLHPHTKTLQNNGRIFREALLTHRANCVQHPHAILPQRLAILKNQILNVMQWQNICQAKALLPMWDDYEYIDKTTKKARQIYGQRQRQYQHDAITLGLVVVKPLSLSPLVTFTPDWERRLNETRERLKNSAWDVRRAAAIALWEIGAGDEASLQVLCAALKDKDNPQAVRHTAATALGQIGAGDEAVLQVLRAVLGDSDKYVSRRRLAAAAFGQIGVSDETLLQTLRDELKGRYTENHIVAARALGHMGACDEPTIHSLLEKSDDASETDIEVIYAVNVALLRIDPKVYAVLPTLLTDPTAQRFFIFSLWLHASSVSIDIEKKQMIVDGQASSISCTPQLLNTFIAELQDFQKRFITATVTTSETLPALLQALAEPMHLLKPSFVPDGQYLWPDQIPNENKPISGLESRVQVLESKSEDHSIRIEENTTTQAHTAEDITGLKSAMAQEVDAREMIEEKLTAAGVLQFGLIASNTRETSHHPYQPGSFQYK